MEKIYTDGSISGKTGGWAYVTEGGLKKSGKLQTRDNYDAELMAVLKAVENCQDKCCLFSDHMGIVIKLREIMSGAYELPHKRRDLWEAIERNKSKIEGVEWLRRMTTYEQVIADEMAKKAANER